VKFLSDIKDIWKDYTLIGLGQSEEPVGTVVVAECYATIDPDIYTQAWNDRSLKEYATALIKRSWGNNLKKFNGIQLPGGVILNGDKIYEEARQK
jgi:hypothetical protein